METIDLNIHHLFMMLAVLQSLCSIFLEDQPRHIKEMNGIDDWSTGLTPVALDEYDFEILGLEDIEEQSVVLEQRLQSLLIEIARCGSQSSQQRWTRDVIKLQSDLEKLQEEVRAAIRKRRGHLKGQFWMRRLFSRSIMEDINLRDQMRDIYRRPFSSLPNIPSLLEDEALDYDSLYKWKSVNRTIDFKHPVKGKLKYLETLLVNLRFWFYKGETVHPLHPCPARDTLHATNHSSEETDENTGSSGTSGTCRPTSSTTSRTYYPKSSGTTRTFHPTSSGTSTTFDPTSSGTSETCHPTSSGTSRTCHPTSSRTTTTFHPTSSGTSRTCRPTSSGTYRTCRPTSSGTSRTCRPTSSGTSRTCRPTSSGTSRTCRPTSSGTSRTCRPTSSGTSRTCRPTSSGTTTTCNPTSFGTSGTCHPTSSGTSRTCRPTSSGTTTTCHPKSSGTTTTCHPKSSGTTTTFHPTSSGTSRTCRPTSSGTSDSGNDGGTEEEVLSEQHQSHSNNPGVSPSQDTNESMLTQECSSHRSDRLVFPSQVRRRHGRPGNRALIPCDVTLPDTEILIPLDSWALQGRSRRRPIALSETQISFPPAPSMHEVQNGICSHSHFPTSTPCQSGDSNQRPTDNKLVSQTTRPPPPP